MPDRTSVVNRAPAIICELAVACEHPVNSRPTPAPRAVTAAQPAGGFPHRFGLAAIYHFDIMIS
jgi:hypothetical protein